MAKPILTAERLRELVHYDPGTGIFTWRLRRKGAPPGKMAGCLTKKGYWQIMIEGTHRKAHHFAWLYIYGHWPKHEIDHINGIPSDNRISNLRDVPTKINAQNKRRAQARNSTGLLGVHYRKDRDIYQTSISIDHKPRYIGSFRTKEEAHAAYIEAKRRLHEGCTI